MVVVAIVAVSGLSVFILAPGARTLRLEAFEFGFDGHFGGPTLRVKVGETLRITLVNRGGIEHEFMVVRDVNEFLEQIQLKVRELQAKGLKEEQIKTSEEIEEIHENFVAVKLMVGGKESMEVEVDRGETAQFEVTFRAPGTFYYVCAEFEATFPSTHADRGMYGTIIVEA
ncbi:MAG: hypothetical protein NZ988_04360 [Thaumarchaeota archaeon]|nr:hypothetical protein [Candidatus Calditenuaceae archaeon]MDW8187260.1 hypothetical protein [Nitrososphaerota archaeon]